MGGKNIVKFIVSKNLLSNFVENWRFDFCGVFYPTLSWSVFSAFDSGAHGAQ
jgi:hypothetical protein